MKWKESMDKVGNCKSHQHKDESNSLIDSVACQRKKRKKEKRENYVRKISNSLIKSFFINQCYWTLTVSCLNLDIEKKKITIARWALWCGRRSHALSIAELHQCQEDKPNDWETKQLHGTHLRNPTDIDSRKIW